MTCLLKKNNLCFLSFIILTTCSKAMDNPIILPSEQENMLLLTSLMNQDLQQQCLFQQQLIQEAEMDRCVAEAKKVIKADAISPYVLALLKKAQGHPEADYLSDPSPENDLRLQNYRLQKGSEAFYVLLKLPQYDTNPNCTLSATKSAAYKLFKKILNNPKSSLSDDKKIRSQASFFLGCMCLKRLGVPLHLATYENSRDYFNNACKWGHPSAQRMLDYLDTCDKQPRSTASTSIQPSTTSIQPSTTSGARQPESSTRKDKVQQLAKTQQLIVTKPAQQPAIVQQPITTAPQKRTYAAAAAATLKKPTAPTQNLKQGNPLPQLPILAIPKQAADNSVELKSETPKQDAQESSTANQFKIKEEQEQLGKHEASEKELMETVSSSQKQQPIVPAGKDDQTKKSNPSVSTEIFSIEEDTGAQVHDLSQVPVYSASSIGLKKKQLPKQDKQKIKKIKRPQHVAKPKNPVDKTTKQDDLMNQSSAATPQRKQVAASKSSEKKESTKKEKKKKDEKKKLKEPSKPAQPSGDEQKIIERDKAYGFVTDLIKHYLDKQTASEILSELYSESLNWPIAQATYKGTYGFLLNKYKIKEATHPELMGILHYSLGNVSDEEAKNIISGFKESDDPVTNWWKARMLLATRLQTDDVDKEILESLKRAFFKPIEHYQTYKNLFVCDDGLINFIRKRADEDPSVAEIFSRAGILFGCNEIGLEPSVLQTYLEYASAKGHVGAAICQAEMYTFGICVERSLPSAIAILQQIVISEKNTVSLTIPLLEAIGKTTGSQHDFLTCLKSSYLYIIEVARRATRDSESKIIEKLEMSELLLQKISKPEQAVAAKLFTETGAYQAVLPLSKHNRQIAKLLLKIAKNRITTFPLSPNDFAQLYEQENERNAQNALCMKSRDRTFNLIPLHFDTQSAAKLMREFKKRLKNCHTVEEMYTILIDLLQTSCCEKKQSDQEFTAIVYYLQGNYEAAKQIISQFTELKSKTAQWYKALILFKTESDTSERNTTILDLVDQVFSCQSLDIKQAQSVLFIDNQFAEFINSTNNHDELGNTRNKILEELFGIKAGMKNKAPGEMSESNLLLLTSAQAIIVSGKQESFPEAVSLLQKLIENEKSANSAVTDQLHLIGCKANDIITKLHAEYLCVIQMAKIQVEDQIVNTLRSTEEKVKSMDPSKQAEAANLLLKSGLYRSLLTLAGQHPRIVLTLGIIACNRILHYNHNEDQYRNIIDLCKQNVTLASDATLDPLIQEFNVQLNLVLQMKGPQ